MNRLFALRTMSFAVGAAGIYSWNLISHSSRDSASGRPLFEACPQIACKGKDELLSMMDGVSSRRVVSMKGKSNDSSSDAKNGKLTPAGLTEKQSGCPPLREELGNHSWHLLHSIAAYYPEAPTSEEKAAALGLIEAIRVLYPCVHCREAFNIDLKRIPPRVNSRSEFTIWMCEQHNLVNESLNIPPFPCTEKALDERWKTGDPSCFTMTDQTAEESLGQASFDDD